MVGKVFPNAVEARAGSRNNVRIYDEIRNIESAILDAIASGVLEVEISNTYMTDIDQEGITYTAIWLDEIENRSLAEQMNIVMRHFQDMGYSITRKLRTDTINSAPIVATVTNGTDPIDPDPGTFEIQRITPGVLNEQGSYSLTFGGLTLTTLPLGDTPDINDLLIALYTTSGYAMAPFTLTATTTDLVLTWKETGNIVGTATLSHTIPINTFKWEVLW